MVLPAFHGGQWIWRQRALRDQHDPRERSERAAVHSDFGHHLQPVRDNAAVSRAHRAARRERMLRRSTPSRPNFHAANDMEAAIGVDRQITKIDHGQRDLRLLAGSAPVLYR